MHGELKDVFDFLTSVRPFDDLSRQELEWVTKSIKIRYFKRRQVIIDPAKQNGYLHIIRTGAVEISDADNAFVTRLHEGDSFGYQTLFEDLNQVHHVHAFEDSLIYQLSRRDFDQLCKKQPDFKDYYLLAEAQRLHKVIDELKTSQPRSSSLQLAVSKAIKREPVTVTDDISIYNAAMKMSDQKVTTLLIVDRDQRLKGIVTDKDLRARVIAHNLDTMHPISSVMTDNPVSIHSGTTAYGANLLMMQHNIHHLPVIDDNRLIGLVSSTDLLRLIDENPIYSIADIYKANHPDALAEISHRIPQLLTKLVDSGLSAFQVGQLISNIVENITIRLLQFAEAELGEKPVDYAWLTAGALGRQEQLLNSDQDNALLLSDEYDPKRHDAYFENLTRLVCQGLKDCGYEFCSGEVMATNPRWRQPLTAWKRYFSQWITEPEPQALLYCSIFFDMRAIYGNQELFSQLKAHYHKLAQENSMFLSYLSVNALENTPPIGFFRRFVLVDDNKHSHHLDLKIRGTAPIVDLARVYSLAAGINSISTYNRILKAKQAGELSEKAAGNLLDAYEFINQFRMRHQAKQVVANQSPDNYADPNQLSSFERDHLRDAFKVVADMQKYLSVRYASPGHMR